MDVLQLKDLQCMARHAVTKLGTNATVVCMSETAALGMEAFKGHAEAFKGRSLHLLVDVRSAFPSKQSPSPNYLWALCINASAQRSLTTMVVCRR